MQIFLQRNFKLFRRRTWSNFVLRFRPENCVSTIKSLDSLRFLTTCSSSSLEYGGCKWCIIESLQQNATYEQHVAKRTERERRLGHLSDFGSHSGLSDTQDEFKVQKSREKWRAEENHWGIHSSSKLRRNVREDIGWRVDSTDGA